MGKELKSLNRSELIDIIYQMKKSEEELQKENERLRKKLENKRITLSRAGSIAEASLALTDIFDTAQSAADSYLAEIKRRHMSVEKECEMLVENARKEADAILRDAQQQRQALSAESKKAYAMLRKKETQIRSDEAALAGREADLHRRETELRRREAALKKKKKELQGSNGKH